MFRWNRKGRLSLSAWSESLYEPQPFKWAYYFLFLQLRAWVIFKSFTNHPYTNRPYLSNMTISLSPTMFNFHSYFDASSYE